jgi:hypothetical protein
MTAACTACTARADGADGAEEASASPGDGSDPAQRIPVTRLTPLTERDGYVPEGEGLEVTAEVPALENLDADLRASVEEAAEAARADGVEEVLVTSGWRSERYQRFLWDAAVRVYASEEEAGRWVATPEESSHVDGAAVDIGRTEAAYWFAEHGAEFGLCQTYANEIWHYELAAEPGGACPEPLADASAG